MNWRAHEETLTLIAIIVVTINIAIPIILWLFFSKTDGMLDRYDIEDGDDMSTLDESFFDDAEPFNSLSDEMKEKFPNVDPLDREIVNEEAEFMYIRYDPVKYTMRGVCESIVIDGERNGTI